MGAPVAIFGAGGLGREAAALAADAGHRISVFIDDDVARQGAVIDGVRVCRADERPREDGVVVAVGNPRIRRAIVRRLEADGAQFATLLHPSAIIGPRVAIGLGAIVAAGCIVTCDVAIGDHCVLGAGGRISHDCVLEEFATLAPGVVLPGQTRLACGAEVAIGATLRQGLTLGQGSMLGMGAVLTRNLGDNWMALGVPARETRELAPWLENSR